MINYHSVKPCFFTRSEGRATKGTRLLELPSDDRVSTIARLAAE